ncbi:YdeI/OmpD-associated family protein [Romeriopsis navalis]|uniref:YdeI/OmpD-associated family protein n=1 Tax=Romeriopsis navalis TaxID=2992132 RepID=UPI003863334E
MFVPDDLATALASHPTAKVNFDHFSNAKTQNIVYWIETAKRDATRLKRIEQAIAAATQNRSPLEQS